MNKYFKALEFDKILDELSEQALSSGGKNCALALEPYSKIKIIEEKQRETQEGKILIEKIGTPPLFTMKEVYLMGGIIEKGDMLMPNQLREISSFISSANRMKSYLKRGVSLDLFLTSWRDAIIDLEHIKDEIDLSISGDMVSSKASSLLGDIRRKIEFTENRIKVKLDELVQSNKKYLSDPMVVTRGGRYTLPFKSEYKNKIKGNVADISRAGGTCFIEPQQIVNIQNELDCLKVEEDSEIRRILYMLTALVEDDFQSISANIDVMEKLDFIFAKAKLSLKYSCCKPEITNDDKIVIKSGTHPLLNKETAIPLNLELYERGLIITGPNTGGKTVVLKTIGLFTLMATCGLNIPAEAATLPFTDRVFCDIGDGQSLEESLSTFSSHITNIIEILKNSTENSLILLDELGSGTDPDEGMAIAIAILDELVGKGARVFSTTHYPEVKSFCDSSKYYAGGSMTFDRQRLCPLYQLKIGTHGESCALFIGEKLGLSKSILEKAEKIANSKYKSDIKIDEIVGKTETKRSAKKPKVEESILYKKEEKFQFEVGDSVTLPKGDIGIVCQIADKKGMVGVFIKNEKTMINYKRLKMKVKYYELYPSDYDFSILFDTVENRKKRRIMSKRHDSSIEIIIP